MKDRDEPKPLPSPPLLGNLSFNADCFDGCDKTNPAASTQSSSSSSGSMGNRNSSGNPTERTTALFSSILFFILGGLCKGIVKGGGVFPATVFSSFSVTVVVVTLVVTVVVVVISNPVTAANAVLRRAACSFCFFLDECGDDRDRLPLVRPTDVLGTKIDGLGDCGDEDFCLVAPLFFLWEEQDFFLLCLLLGDARECGCSGFSARTTEYSSSSLML
jgi:hypothetical protein